MLQKGNLKKYFHDTVLGFVDNRTIPRSGSTFCALYAESTDPAHKARVVAFKMKCQHTLAVSLVLLSSNSLALPDDNKQLLQLSAHFADMSQKTHTGTFTGQVEVDQGTTHIRAAKAITKTDEKNKIAQAIIYGNNLAQAHFWTLPAKNKPLFHAFADTIYYYPNRHRIELLGHAHIEQGRDSFSAPQISYDTEQHHVLSKSDKVARTTIIIHPENTNTVMQGQP